MTTDKTMHALERKIRLEQLEQMRNCHTKMAQGSRNFGESPWFKAGMLLIILSFVLESASNYIANNTVLILLECVAGTVALLWIVAANKEHEQLRNEKLSPQNELDVLLLEYNPINKEAYVALQNTVQQTGHIEKEALHEFLARERRAINEHLSPHVPWAFVSKKVDIKGAED